MIRIALLLSVGAVVSLPAAGALGLSAPASVVVGDAFSVSLPVVTGITRASIELEDSGGRVVAVSRAFRLPPTRNRGVREWVAPVGVPSTILPGAYQIVASEVIGGRVIRSRATIEVGARQFRHEDIDLNGRLSLLQSENTKLKRSQALELWHVLTRFDPSAVYQSGPLIVPVEHYFVSSPFGERRLFVLAHGGDEASVHQGIDLAVPGGTRIKAAGAGKVVFAGPLLMTGNTVVIEQLPEVFSLYFHMEHSLVHVGQMVSQGETIGLVGSTGLATGPHLHWQVEVDGVAVDPMSLLRTGLINPAFQHQPG